MKGESTYHVTNAALSAEAALLFTTAKQALDEDDLKKIEPIVKRIEDWDSVTETALRKFSAPFLYRALSACSTDVIPAATIKGLRRATDLTKLRVLKIAAAQIAFHKSCIDSLKVRHAYIKGIALSQQFHGNYVERFSRDIDVLVDEDRFEEVIFAAADKGYRVIISHQPVKFAGSRNDLKFVARFRRVVELLSADNVQIEVHRRLDKNSLIFDSKRALDTVEPVNLAGVTLQTLNRSLHFTYVCYHHSRHLWSHLHWLADLDLMIKSPRLRDHELRTTADKLGLWPTVEASIEFHKLAFAPKRWQECLGKRGLAFQFLKASLINLSGGLELEYKLRKDSFTRDLMEKNQISSDRLAWNSINIWRSKLSPTNEQYIDFPVPASFFWLYRLQRPISLFAKRVKQFFSHKNVLE